MATHSKFIKDESLFKVENGKLIETNSLGTNVAAKMNRSTGDLEAINTDECECLLSKNYGNHINDNGGIWWTNPDNQVFGTEKTGGHGAWGIYKQSNIYTTARQYAGKDNQYGIHIFRYPNISHSLTWGGLSIGLPGDVKLRNHKYRVSFDYRGQTGGANLDVYTCYSVGWCDHAIGLPGAWNSNFSFDTDWEWRRFEYDYEVEDAKLDWIPGSNRPAWDPNTTYGTGWYAVTYNGYVYRHRSGWPAPTMGVDPETEYQQGGIWDWKIPMTAGYLDVYRNMKIGFKYNTQGNRGTHVYIDNIQITDITTNQRWKFNGSGWEADNLSEGTTHIFAKGTAYLGLDTFDGSGTDIFAVEGNRVLEVNGTQIYNTTGRGLRLTVIDEATSNVLSDTLYDTYADDNARTNLANALSNILSSHLWVLTSYDAINTNTALDNQMKAMGAVLHNDNGEYHSIFNGGGVRHPYAAVGRGQQIIKEDGANQYDNVYKRKGVIDLRV